MIEIIWDEAFKKIYKKRIRYNQNLKEFSRKILFL